MFVEKRTEGDDQHFQSSREQSKLRAKSQRPRCNTLANRKSKNY